MGRMAIIIVIGLSLTVGIVGYSLNNSKTGVIENVAGFDKYTMARNIAHTAVNMALRALDRNDSIFIVTKSMSVSVMGGSAGITYSYPSLPSLDTIELQATARFMDTTRTMKLRLKRTTIPFPDVNQPVALRVPNVDFTMSGNPTIDGRNHSIFGSLLPPSADDRPGVGVITPSDTTKVLAYASKIQGTGVVVLDSSIADPTPYVPEYINAADYTWGSGTYNGNNTWGSAASPVIIFCDGDVKFNGDAEGWGILVVKGNLEFRGGFTFHGLVITYSDVTIECAFASGTPDIIGATLVAGPSGSKFTMKGNSTVAFSQPALDMAQYINKLQVYRVMRWYE